MLVGDASDIPLEFHGTDYIEGGTGDDEILGQGGADILLAGEGDDRVFGGEGDDFLGGGSGNDQLAGDDDSQPTEFGSDTIDGGEGDDEVWGNGGNDFLYGGEGNDVIQGDALETVIENQGDDYIEGGRGEDVIFGQGGDDILHGGFDDDRLFGGDGDDTISGGAGNDYVLGEGGDDIIVGDEGVNQLYGGGGNDHITGGLDSNYLFGNTGNDTLISQGLLDSLKGGSGDDDYIVDLHIGSTVYIEDSEGKNTLNITDSGTSEVQISKDGSTLRIATSVGQVFINNWVPGAFESYNLPDGRQLDADAISLLANQAPVPQEAVSVEIMEDDHFSYKLDQGLFSDPEGESLTYAVSLTNGHPLPPWLSYDVHNKRLSGTPKNKDVGDLEIIITASDSVGLTATNSLIINVHNTNDSPLATDDHILPPTNGLALSSISEFDQAFDLQEPFNPSEYHSEVYFKELSGRKLLFWKTQSTGSSNEKTGWWFQEIDDTGTPLGDATLIDMGSHPVTRIEELNGRIAILSEGLVDDFGIEIQSSSVVYVDENLKVSSLEQLDSSDFLLKGKALPGSNLRIELDEYLSDGYLVTRVHDKVTGNQIGEYGFDALLSDQFSGIYIENVDFGILPVNATQFFVSSTAHVNSEEGEEEGFSGGTYILLGLVDTQDGTNSDWTKTIFLPEGQDLVDLQLIDIGEGEKGILTVYTKGLSDSSKMLAAQTFDLAGQTIGDEITLNNTPIDANITLDGESILVLGGEAFVAWPNLDLSSSDGFTNNSWVSISALKQGQAINSEILISPLENDSDPDSLHRDEKLTLVSADIVSGFGELELVGNRISYKADGKYDYLAKGSKANVLIEYTISDDSGAQSTAKITVNLDGTASYGQAGLGQYVDLFPVSGVNRITTDDGNDFVAVQPVTDESTSISVSTGGGDDVLHIAGSFSKTLTELFGGEGSDRYVFNGVHLDGIYQINDSWGYNEIEIGRPFGDVNPNLGIGSLKISFNGIPMEIHLENFDPDNVLGGPRDIQTFHFSDVSLSYEELVAQGFDLNGDSANNTISGTSVTDRITGSGGNDRLFGGKGDDTYIFEAGFGLDRIEDSEGINAIKFLEGVSIQDLEFSLTGKDLIIQVTPEDSITVVDWLTLRSGSISQIVAADSVLTAQEIEEKVISLVINPIAPIQIQEDDEYTGLNILDYVEGVAKLVNIELVDISSGAVVDWFTGNPSSGELVITPGNDEVGQKEYTIRVTDQSGNIAEQVLSIDVVNTNDAPEIERQIEDQTIDEDSDFNFTLPSDLFSDPDAGDQLSYRVTLSDGADLPDWISFDSSTLVLSGTPLNSDVGSIDIKVQAVDLEGEAAQQQFALTVKNTNDAPKIVNSIHDVEASLSESINIEISDNLFLDVDLGDELTIAVEGSHGALPSWLHYDRDTMLLTGIADVDGLGTNSVRVTATDLSGETSSFDFSINVSMGNDDVVGTAMNDTLFANFFHSSKLYGGSGNDYLIGFFGDDQIFGGGDADTITGGYGADRLFGGSGEDSIRGGLGDDQIVGGTGDDLLYGGLGDDHYIIGKNHGHDIIIESNFFSSGSDLLSFRDGIAKEELWFEREGSDLSIKVLGTDSSVTIQNWFGWWETRVEQIMVGDAKLDSNAVDTLIQAMSDYSFEDISNSEYIDDQLLSVVHENWLFLG